MRMSSQCVELQTASVKHAFPGAPDVPHKRANQVERDSHGPDLGPRSPLQDVASGGSAHYTCQHTCRQQSGSQNHTISEHQGLLAAGPINAASVGRARSSPAVLLSPSSTPA